MDRENYSQLMAEDDRESDRALIEKLVGALRDIKRFSDEEWARTVAREALSLAESRLAAKGDGG